MSECILSKIAGKILPCSKEKCELYCQSKEIEDSGMCGITMAFFQAFMPKAEVSDTGVAELGDGMTSSEIGNVLQQALSKK